jgi:hypothetical protein
VYFMFKNGTKTSLARITALALMGAAPLAIFAQESANRGQRLPAFFGVAPWTDGTITDQTIDSRRGAGLPTSTFTITATKDGNSYSGTIVGGSPFASPLQTTPLKAVVVPTIISIGTSTFDPTVGDSCNSTSALAAFNASPLVVPTSIGFNGVNITGQYVDAFRQAEFSTLVGGSSYSNPITFTTAAPVTISSSVVGTNGTTYSSGCSLLGILSNSWFNKYLVRTLLPQLKSAGVVSPTSLVIFLVKNMVQSTSTPPSVNTCCILGYHGATGRPAQTYTPLDYDTTGLFGPAISDTSIAAHEIAEWQDNPLGTNPTPAWGGIGQVSSCQSNLEVGDPLTGTNMPLVNGYHLQELAFFSWYFNAQATPSLGTGGKFSGNGTFGGPSMVCPPGGTF